MNRNSLLTNIVATIFIWLSVVVVRLISTEPGVTTFGIIVGIGTTAALWLIWALNELNNANHASPEKAKRSATSGDDSRLSLLLELLDEDERMALKQRLINDMGTDGEVYSLADLLASQERRSNQQK